MDKVHSYRFALRPIHINRIDANLDRRQPGTLRCIPNRVNVTIHGRDPSRLAGRMPQTNLIGPQHPYLDDDRDQ